MGGLYFCMGYCGHGVAMSSYLGDRIADLIAGRPVDTPFFEITRFPTNPLYRGRPWFLPLAGGYFRTLDLPQVETRAGPSPVYPGAHRHIP